MVESKTFLLDELKKIEYWEQDQKDLWFWEKLGRLPFKMLDYITPNVIHQKLGLLFDEVGSYIQTGGRYLVQEHKIFEKFLSNNEIRSLSDVKDLPIQKMDEVCNNIIQSRITIAQYQGATTGIGGVFTLAVDIPFLLGLSLKTLQEIALAYGYNPNEKRERLFIVKCLQFATSDVAGKKTILEQLSSLQDDKHQIFSQVQGWREVIATFRDQFGWKKLFQLVPIAGILFGAIINRSMIADVAETGKMLYRKRRILEKLSTFEDGGSI